MLETQQEQLSKTLVKLHSQAQSASESKLNNLSIQELLDKFPNSLIDDRDELPRKKARKSPESEAGSASVSPPAQAQPQVKLESDYGDYNTISIPKAATFPTMTDADLMNLNSLDVGPNMGMGMMPVEDNLPELDPTVWDGLNLDLFNQWTTEPPALGQGFSQLQQKTWSNDQIGSGSVFCDPRSMSMPL